MKRWLWLLWGLWLAAWYTPVEAVAARYQVIDLGTPGEVQSTAWAINNKGQVLGGQKQASNEYSYHLFVWDRGVMTDLNLRGWPVAINNLGHIVFDTEVHDKRRAFLWDQGVLTDLGTLEGMNSTSAKDINDSKQVVGNAYIKDTSFNRAFLWENGVMKNLGTLPEDDDSNAYGINNAGKVVGNSSTKKTFGSRAVLWQSGIPQAINGLPGFSSQGAGDINENGQVVGWSMNNSDPTKSSSFLWHSGTVVNLGHLPGRAHTSARALNKLGQVVGDCSGPACIWENGVITNLNSLIPPDSGWYLKAAYDINDAGQIVGSGSYQGQEYRAFLLTIPPVKGDVDGDRVVNLVDAIVQMQILSGMSTEGKNITPDADVNNDGRIGLAEGIYILQKVAGMR